MINQIILSTLLFIWWIPSGVCDTEVSRSLTQIAASIKQKEMIYTAALISTKFCRGSGTVVNKTPTQTKGTYRYYVLTNSHVTRTRLTPRLSGVNFFTGELATKIIDTGCSVTVFDNVAEAYETYATKVLIENLKHDLAVVSFESSKVFETAKIATKEMLDNVNVFDEVFAIGCQLGSSPSPTVGIISQILTDKSNDKEWVIYYSTAQLAPGSSGGGLFREYSGHYYLIGIPFGVGVVYGGQFIPHLGRSISVDTARELIGPPAIYN